MTKPIRFLITSGGTRVPLDPVRYIGNHSTGHFGAEIARHALYAGHQVHSLVAKGATAPFSYQLNYYQQENLKEQLNHLAQLHIEYQQYKTQYQETRFATLSDYALLLETIIKVEQPQVVILSAAVSDYTVANYSSQKLRSNNELNMQLQPVPKLIQEIKKWLPGTFLVGFKLLINASDDELVQHARQSIVNNQCDLVIANNLQTKLRGCHEIIIVEPNGDFKKYTQHLAQTVMTHIEENYK